MKLSSTSDAEIIQFRLSIQERLRVHVMAAIEAVLEEELTTTRPPRAPWSTRQRFQTARRAGRSRLRPAPTIYSTAMVRAIEISTVAGEPSPGSSPVEVVVTDRVCAADASGPPPSLWSPAPSSCPVVNASGNTTRSATLWAGKRIHYPSQVPSCLAIDPYRGCMEAL